ncbi:hypothetical protein AXI70_gp11 [Cronobacter phage Dev-CD-23823]|uniref:Uncharacterized protein n=1 Tax=Cronobacter phage Dev-CD-23823 TaxID=1712539 RepID=A0A0K8IXM4_9CAUD|nr:hypothetical protein AXI70_gp11 [Cronobacter phage Dev-CD-23823]CUH74586.1 hypothetical protein [Cronobacter phage Dev-CD-23823]
MANKDTALQAAKIRITKLERILDDTELKLAQETKYTTELMRAYKQVRSDELAATRSANEWRREALKFRHKAEQSRLIAVTLGLCLLMAIGSICAGAFA